MRAADAIADMANRPYDVMITGTWIRSQELLSAPGSVGDGSRRYAEKSDNAIEVQASAMHNGAGSLFL
jgi:hypothetical protein